jgi:oligopeptide transport system permease protein
MQKFDLKSMSLSGKFALCSLILLHVFVFISPFFLQDPHFQNLSNVLSSPNTKHWLGTDELGRDMLSRLALGGQTSLIIALVATLVSVFIGCAYGIICGYCGGMIDQIGMRIVDLLYAMPYMFLVIILISFLGKNIFVLFIALGAVQWLTTARIVRAQVMTLKNQDFILAARSLGLPFRKIAINHLMPNLTGTLAIYSTLTIPSIILQEAFLSFLGLNVSSCSWGLLASEGAQLIDIAWWALLFPSLILSLTLLSYNFLGEELRKIFDPKEPH